MAALPNIIDFLMYIHVFIDMCICFSYDKQSFTSLSLKRLHAEFCIKKKEKKEAGPLSQSEHEHVD